MTPIGTKLEEILLEYLDELDAMKASGGEWKSIKPVNYIVITDGAPSAFCLVFPNCPPTDLEF